MANTIEAYVHRIGRTGRAGKTGVAITFLGHEEDEVLYDLKNEISKSERSRLDPELSRHPAAQNRIAVRVSFFEPSQDRTAVLYWC